MGTEDDVGRTLLIGSAGQCYGRDAIYPAFKRRSSEGFPAFPFLRRARIVAILGYQMPVAFACQCRDLTLRKGHRTRANCAVELGKGGDNRKAAHVGCRGIPCSKRDLRKLAQTEANETSRVGGRTWKLNRDDATANQLDHVSWNTKLELDVSRIRSGSVPFHCEDHVGV